MGQKESKDRLSKQDLEMLKTSTRFDEDTIIEWYRGFKSDCPDGRLTPKAFMAIYSKCFPTGNANEFCDHVFRTFDTDKNGFIDFKEFLLAIDVTSSGKPEEKLNWAFKGKRYTGLQRLGIHALCRAEFVVLLMYHIKCHMYDVDGNGFIDLNEMTKIVKSIYNMMGPNHVAMDQFESPEARAEGIFKRMDVNNDGKVTKQEFVRCCLEDQKLIELLTPHTA